ncbi:MAG: hypothetical protein HFP77_00840 [Methylococcales symbiont of Iophon sp. n. MRB-2018]|nr:MAG: hypothetical protein HFP77_00840 [Methylococcales symbiont of Iophon sp. n. MRB-2018]KAF3980124.1 MAG: hypothetical protein HFP76_03795 [Methylococcales symbiont of Iophon sp. n. MRB-2018]
MKWSKWLENWGMTSLKIKAPFLDMEWKPQDEDKSAAWDLYIELLTRITTQPLVGNHGDEETALKSICSIFPLTREVIKLNGRYCIEFTKIAIIILNQKIRPFTAKWHKLSEQNAFNDAEKCKEFRRELSALQKDLKIYTQMLADMAGVENLVNLENET